MSFFKGFTHSVKKAVSSTVSAPEHPSDANDPAFEAAVADFNVFHSAVTALDRSLSEYAKHAFELYSSSFSIIHDMSTAITNNDETALRNTFAATRDAHAVLTGEREQQLSQELRDNCAKPVSEELQRHAELNALIQKRRDLGKEQDYYSGKWESLQKEKAAAEQKGKAIDQEKLDRNQAKHDQAVKAFDEANYQAIHQVNACVANKGPPPPHRLRWL